MSQKQNGTVTQKRVNEYLKQRKRKVHSKDISSDKKEKHVKTRNAAGPTSSVADVGLSDKTERDFRELRKFDLDPAYGPSIDSSRVERWNRAESLGLAPPRHIKKLLDDNCSDKRYTCTLWQDHVLLSISST